MKKSSSGQIDIFITPPQSQRNYEENARNLINVRFQLTIDPNLRPLLSSWISKSQSCSQ